MTDIIIPCDTFARLSTLAVDASDDDFRCIRLDNGIAIASNRRLMALEKINTFEGVLHIVVDAALVSQCKTEAAWGSDLIVSYTPELNIAVAKTTLGYIHPGNALVIQQVPDNYNRWREVAERCRVPSDQSHGAMFWDADLIAKLAYTSPSGRVVFEENINATGRPTLMRDITSHEWVGIFQPWSIDVNHSPAKLQSWVR